MPAICGQARALHRHVRAVVLIVALAFPVAAQANGAFPAPSRIFLPEGRPDEVIVTTNFGLIATSDGAKIWAWTCEHGQGDLGYLYQQAPPPSRRILAVATMGLVYTDDDACTWSVASGFLAGAMVSDFFVDRSDGRRVLAIAHRTEVGVQSFALFVSSDGGVTFGGTAIYLAPPGNRLDSVEVSVGDPNRVYLTASRIVADGTGPWLVRSDDGARSFSVTDVSGQAGPGMLRIAAVDPVEPDRVYFRSSGATERLMTTVDGGRTFRTALAAEGSMQFSAFLRRQDGTLLAATMDGLSGLLFRSTDRGLSFEMLPENLHLGSLGERDGVLYALGDGITDPFLVGLSRDNGATFEPFLNYADIKGTRACPTDLLAACGGSCENLQNAGLFRPEICQTVVGTANTDGGAGDGGVRDAANDSHDAANDGRDAANDGRLGAANDSRDAAKDGRLGAARSTSGCGCAVSDSDGIRYAGFAFLLLAWIVSRAWRVTSSTDIRS